MWYARLKVRVWGLRRLLCTLSCQSTILYPKKIMVKMSDEFVMCNLVEAFTEWCGQEVQGESVVIVV